MMITSRTPVPFTLLLQLVALQCVVAGLHPSERIGWYEASREGPASSARRPAHGLLDRERRGRGRAETRGGPRGAGAGCARDPPAPLRGRGGTSGPSPPP